VLTATLTSADRTEGRTHLARRTFDVIDVVEILKHWQAGRNVSEIARGLGVDRKTVRKYLAPAEAEGPSPGAPSRSPEEWARRVKEWFPELTDPRARSSTASEFAHHEKYIREHVSVNTLATIHQRLRDDHGLQASYSSLLRYARVEFADETALAQVTVLKDDPPAGEEAQLDYGYLGRFLDPLSGKLLRVWALVMVLAMSRHLFVYPVFRMTQTAFVEAHVAAFSFFGGVPRRLVCDNLTSGVLRSDLYDPRINRAYRELSVHYGCLVDPARLAHPKDKPRVERPMPYVRDSFFRGRDFASLAQMRAEAASWSLKVAGLRACRPLGGAAPYVVFQATEAAALLPLLARPFELASWHTPKVAPDAHVMVAGALYSVPFGLIGKRLDVRASETMVYCFLDGELVKTHARLKKGKRSTDWADYPPEKVAFLMRNPAWCRRQAKELGPATTAVIDSLLGLQALHRLRSAQGIIGLADRHGKERLEAACSFAFAAGDPSYRTVRGILTAGREALTDPEPTGTMTAPAHLHGPDTLFAYLEA
jgi:transposase